MELIVDYGRGNLKSVKNALDQLGVDTVIGNTKEALDQADSLIIPGVGAFGDAMEALERLDLVQPIRKAAADGKRILGICLGMQILYETGFEFGKHEGLGLIPGSVDYLDVDLKVPHMGWNDLTFAQPNDPILKYSKEGDYVYFVHSYYAVSDGSEIVAYTNYGRKIPAIVRKGNVYGIQFHPEKSGTVGAGILRAYKELLI